jgi:hypothetical protein
MNETVVFSAAYYIGASSFDGLNVLPAEFGFGLIALMWRFVVLL